MKMEEREILSENESGGSDALFLLSKSEEHLRRFCLVRAKNGESPAKA
jgi:hypothetical protein